MQMLAQISVLKAVLLLSSTFDLNIGLSTFCSCWSSTALWQSVDIFAGNFDTNVLPRLLQLALKAFL